MLAAGSPVSVPDNLSPHNLRSDTRLQANSFRAFIPQPTVGWRSFFTAPPKPFVFWCSFPVKSISSRRPILYKASSRQRRRVFEYKYKCAIKLIIICLTLDAIRFAIRLFEVYPWPSHSACKHLMMSTLNPILRKDIKKGIIFFIICNLYCVK